MDKKTLRKEILVKRSQIEDAYRRDAITCVTNKILNQPYFIDAQTIASFVSFRDEIDMSEINQAILLQNKTLVLPYISMEKHEMSFHVVTHLDELIKNDFGLFEPNPVIHNRMPIHQIDLILTPGVAFSTNGYRLGYGGGFYDRLFSELSKATPKIGIAFDLQYVFEIPIDSFDQPITHLVTEKNSFVF